MGALDGKVAVVTGAAHGLGRLHALGLAAEGAAASQLLDRKIESDLVPGPVEFYVLLPPGYSDQGERYPLVLDLHGGGGSRAVLERQRPLFDQLWSEGRIAPMVIVMASVTPRCFYMDFRDGKERWESFLLGPFLDHVRATWHVRQDQRGTFVTGISMGGMGSLRMAFKYPERFGAVAGMEPGIEPILEWKEMRPKHRFWRSDELMMEAYGNPIDPDYWAANNPPAIAIANADRIRASGLKILIEAGDQDMFWLYEGTRFLHDVLWNQKIRHEFHLYLGEDHVGSSLGRRTETAFEFLTATLRDPAPDPQIEAARRRIDPLKQPLDEADHYGVDADQIRGGGASPARTTP
jgi:S-formylglutathione hydrolase